MKKYALPVFVGMQDGTYALRGKRICGTNLNNSYLWLRVAGICEKVVTFAQIKKNSFPMNINKAFLCTVVVAILAGFALQSCNDDDNYGERKKKNARL
ncbi:MAG: hypothetical protein V8Q65_06810 [Bacteroidaceae bacterium]